MSVLFFPPHLQCIVDFETVTIAVISVWDLLQIHVLPDLARHTRNAHPEMAAEIARRHLRLVYYIIPFIELLLFIELLVTFFRYIFI